MIRLKFWQWLILATPVITLISFFVIATGIQIHAWGINWIWGIFILIFVAWRWLLVKWTKPLFPSLDDISNFSIITPAWVTGKKEDTEINQQIESALQNIILKTREDPPIWENLQLFFQRCQDLVTAIAKVYHPEVEYPLLNIYIPQAYGLIRGTVDDMDKWMMQLSPVLNQVTIAQGYQSYQLYRKLQPSARKLWQIWNWAQWLINPTVAAAKLASVETNKQANQELLMNLSQVGREVALKNLARQCVLLYGGSDLPADKFNFTSPSQILPIVKTQTLQEILSQAQKPEQIKQKPINILLVGRTGSGKSSLINTLFQADRAQVDVLPSTMEIKHYRWKTETEEIVSLIDTPGYEQVDRGEYAQKVLEYAQNADLILLLNPALDPSLQMDKDFLVKFRQNHPDIPIFTIITQVDRLRPLREWQPPYNWLTGNKPKEISIREAVKYRQETLGDFSTMILPLVTSDIDRTAWYDDILAINILSSIEPAKQIRLARFLRNLEAKSIAATKIIEKYCFQMATSQGLTALLKSPVLQFISTVTTGSPRLALLLAEKIPIEQLPVVIGKMQLAYELFNLLNSDKEAKIEFDLLSLWTLLLENNALPEKEAYAFGYALVEFWTKKLTFNQLEEKYKFYLKSS